MSPMRQYILDREAAVCKAMANPARLQLLDILSQGECTASDLHLRVGISAANLSQHLSVLKNAGLVRVRRSGKHVHVRVANCRIAQAREALGKILKAVVLDLHPLRSECGGCPIANTMCKPEVAETVGLRSCETVEDHPELDHIEQLANPLSS